MAGIEAPKEAPKDATQKMGEFMPAADQLGKGPEVKYKAEAFTKEELDKKVGKPRKEITGAKKASFKDIIQQAKDAIKQNSADGKVSHGDTQNFSIDNTEYVYLRDETKKGANKDRLFKKV